jgi:hypothetical protein
MKAKCENGYQRYRVWIRFSNEIQRTLQPVEKSSAAEIPK